MKSNSSDSSIIVNQKTNLSLSIPGRRDRLDLNELGFKMMRMRSLIATLDKIQPHQITMKSRVILEPPPALMSSQHLCAPTKPDTSHIVHELYVSRPTKGESTQSDSCRSRRYMHRHGAHAASATWTAIGTGTHNHYSP